MISKDWEGFYNIQHPNLGWEVIENAIRAELDVTCPLKTFKVQEIKEAWVTDELLEEIKDKDRLLNIAKKFNREEDWVLARRERNRVSKLVRGAKAEFVKERQKELEGEPRKFWKLISEIVPGKKQTQRGIHLVNQTNRSEIEESKVADHINEFFTSVGAGLAKGKNETWQFHGEVAEADCPPLTTDYEQVLELCKEISTTKSSGINNIASKIFKCAFMVLIPQLVYLFNQSFSTGIFPERWKCATVVPLFKSGDRTDVGNYRPISLLPLPGKLLEKIAHHNISLFLENNDILSDKQNGFRKGHSTVSAVADITDDLFSAINNSEVSMAVFVDLRKAFDTVSHDILCKKIERYGLRGSVLKWCRHYLERRSQVTLANGTRSGINYIEYGVPQGSVLGPLFFILYVNDLQQAVNDVNVQLYADDTVLYTADCSTNVITNKLQRGLRKFYKWCISNKPTVNPAKTKMMTFGTRHSIKRTKQCQLYLGGERIQRVSTYKYLGFTLDSTLTFKNQIADVTQKVIHKRILLARMMCFLTKATALSIYKMMILPYFDYCDVIYQTACMSDLDKLQRLQNKCLKTCLGLNRLHETKEVHSMAKCAYLGSRRKAHVHNFMYKRQSRARLMDVREINTRQHDAPLFLVNHPGKEAFKRSVQYAGSVMWNDLPVNVRLTDNYLVFKARQKNLMLACYT